MTIQIVDVTSLGIVMAADGAISFDRPTEEPRETGDWRRRKLFQVPRLRAAIGYFGLATIGGNSLDLWLEKFIHDNSNMATGKDFATRLAETLSGSITPQESKYKLGFHLGCYRFSGANAIPEMHFIRNYRGSSMPSSKFEATEEILGNHFHQLTEDELLDMLADRHPIFFQNGYREIYNAFSLPIVNAFYTTVWTNPEFIGEPDTIQDWGLVVEFRLRVVRLLFEKFYGKPGQQPVGGRLFFIAIPSNSSEPIAEWTVG